MKKTALPLRLMSAFLAGLVLFTSCSSTTIIQSRPSSANLYIDGQSVGTTPYTHTDSKISGSPVAVRLQLDGYEELETFFYRSEDVDVGAIIGGIFFLFPFLWTMKYYPSRTYEMKPLDNSYPSEVQMKQSNKEFMSKADRLRELKQLLDEGVITKEEFEKEKKKILEEGS